MNEVIQYLSDHPIQYAATLGLDGKAKVRPFQYMMESGGKLWFCTNSKKDVFKELSASPWIELCVASDDNRWLRLSGKVKFQNNLEVKTSIFEISPLVKGIYKTPDNPIFEVFYLEEVSALFASLAGQPPRVISL